MVRLSDANAARAINGDFENLFGGAAEEIVSRIGRATRMMAGLNTSWNPEFMLKNKVRDSAWALFYNWLDKEGSARGYLRNQGPAHAAIYRYHTNGARPLTMNERAGYDLYSAEGRQRATERYGAARARDKHWLLELRKTDGRIKKLTQERNETEQGSPEYKALTREMNRLRSDFLTRYDLGAPEGPAQEAE